MTADKIDMHVHSDNSPDGEHSAVLLCEYAEKAGLRAIAITDHCECNEYIEKGYNKSIRQSNFEATKAQSVFEGRLLVLRGIELGQPNQNSEAAKNVLSSCEFDFVLASLHNLVGMEDFYYLDYSDSKNDYRAVLDKYFAELITIAEEYDFDSLAHLTYPIRYFGIDINDIDFKRYDAVTDKILTAVAERGKALEINTSGIRKGLGYLVPHDYYIKRFKELGGKYITIGSDAHTCHDVGSDIGVGLKAAFDCGFKEIALYQNREPVLIPIE